MVYKFQFIKYFGLNCFRPYLFGIGVILLLNACSDQTSNKGIQKVPTVALQTILISPKEVDLTVGQTVHLTVMLADASGNLLPKRKVAATFNIDSQVQSQTIGDKLGRTGRVVTWISSEPFHVEVDDGGLVTAVGVGDAIITATSEGANTSININVSEPPFSNLTVNPTSAELLIGESLQLTAISQNEGGNQLKEPVIWSSDNPASLIVDTSGLAKAISSGKATVTAKNAVDSGFSNFTILPAKIIHGLDFPGNAGVNKTMRFEFTEPLAAYPATYIWRAYPRQQASYYTAFFWGNNGSFFNSNTYYGFHPYPDWKSARLHFWEIAAPPGGDHVNDSNVDYDRWYTQVAICNLSENTTVIEFYWDWPDTSKVVRYVGEQYIDPPIPALIVGDAPWNQGHEVWDGILRGFQFYDTALNLLEIKGEIATPGVSQTPWYLNLNPTPEDITDKSGKGNNPAWVGSERPVLWSGKLIENAIIKNTPASH